MKNLAHKNAWCCLNWGIFHFYINFEYVHEDGQGNLFNDKGMAVAAVEMEVDEEVNPIKTVTNCGMHQELKPSKKPEKVATAIIM